MPRKHIPGYTLLKFTATNNYSHAYIWLKGQQVKIRHVITISRFSFFFKVHNARFSWVIVVLPTSLVYHRVIDIIVVESVVVLRAFVDK